MSDRIDAIRERATTARTDGWGVQITPDRRWANVVRGDEVVARCADDDHADLIANASADLAYLLAELDKAREREARLLAKIPEAWSEGAEDEARERDGDEYAITVTCSMSNPYLDWSEPDEDGWRHSSPTADPFKDKP